MVRVVSEPIYKWEYVLGQSVAVHQAHTFTNSFTHMGNLAQPIQKSKNLEETHIKIFLGGARKLNSWEESHRDMGGNMQSPH